MLKCDGYKMFHGSATVTPVNDKPPYTMIGTWLYHPEKKYWYCEQDTGARWAVGFDPALISDIKDDAA